MLRTSLTILLLGLLAARAGAQESWSLMTADLKTEPAALKGIDADGVHVTVAGADRVVPMGQFVEVSRALPAVPLAGRFALHLTGGDLVGGEPVSVRGEQLVWKTPAAGETEIPLRSVSGLTKAGATLPGAPPKDDVVTLANGDTVHGTVADLGAAKITIQTDAGPSDVPLDSVVSVAFAASAAGGRDKPGFRVRLDDGSSLLATAVTADDATLRLTLPGGKDGHAEPRPVELSRVAGIEQVNGPVSWLSSRAPNQNVYLRYLSNNSEYPARMNANYRGEPIYFKDRRYLRGIGVHSYSKLVFPLDGKSYTTFRTRYAIDPSATLGQADVTVRVKLDDRVVHEREHFHAGELSPPVVVDLNGATRLTLEVDFGANGNAEDRLNWIEPALLKVKPTTEPAEPEAGPTPPAPATNPAAPERASATTEPAATSATTRVTTTHTETITHTDSGPAPEAPAPPAGPKP